MTETNTLTPLYDTIALGLVEGHLRAALVEAREALALCKAFEINRFGDTYGLTQGAVDSLFDALLSMPERPVFRAGDEAKLCNQ
ncbi:hypothetical protein [uncultured Mobiluncus sp.]|uniref:hypothetical protein n=1 Tax=uncultured Mobiluncus sp. TaxID=293425 RepID=UPI0026195824|nr:hypothetical protein [uncultured Mobiluncus sp.]